MLFTSAGEILPNHKIRSITLSDSPQLPDGDYAFIDLYCTDLSCDCRKTIIHIFCNDQHVSTVHFGWEKPAFYVKWGRGFNDSLNRDMSGLSIDPASPNLINPAATIDFVKHILNEQWLTHIKSTYNKVRETLKNQQNNTAIHFEPKTSRNALCPCGSGKKYKRCCIN